jgi:hypothetical protein
LRTIRLTLVGDPRVDMELLGGIAQRQQDLPERQGILAARDGHEHALARGT